MAMRRAKPTPKAVAERLAHLQSHAGRPSGGHTESAQGENGGTGGPSLYGAVGDRSAADLATAFTRAFPQAASADPMWRTAALGGAGDVVVVITLDESGHIDSTNVQGSPTPALASAIRRTLALVKSRPFTAKGKTTKLELTANVSSDAVHDGLHGDVFAIGGSYAGGEGSAFFALAIGRRIDVRVRAKWAHGAGCSQERKEDENFRGREVACERIASPSVCLLGVLCVSLAPLAISRSTAARVMEGKACPEALSGGPSETATLRDARGADGREELLRAELLFFLVCVDRDERAAATDVRLVLARLILRDAEADERAREPADRRARGETGQGRHDRARRDEGSEARNREETDAREQAERAAEEAARADAGDRAVGRFRLVMRLRIDRALHDVLAVGVRKENGDVAVREPRVAELRDDGVRLLFRLNGADDCFFHDLFLDPYGFTTSWSSTLVTPSVFFAMPSISSFSAVDFTVPMSVTLVPWVMIFTFFAPNESVFDAIIRRRMLADDFTSALDSP